MLMNNPPVNARSKREKRWKVTRILGIALCLCPLILSVSCRYDMQDQPRYKAYKKSNFFADGKAMRDLPEGSVARGMLRADKAFYTGKKENADPNAPVQTTTDASGNMLVSTFPNDIEKIPVQISKNF